MRRAVLPALVFLACHRVEPGANDAAVAPSAAPSASASAARVPRPPPPDPFAAPRFVLVKWNAAHNTHDTSALQALYAPRVKYYGQTLAGSACAKGKAAAFAKAPDYAQAIRDASFTKQDSSWLVSFTKTSTSRGKSKDYPAYLVVADGHITEEGDKVTDANLAKLAASDWCHDASGPNDVVKPPFTIGVKSAWDAILKGQRIKELTATHPQGLMIDPPSECPKPCNGDPYACAHFRISDPSTLAVRSDGQVLNDAEYIEDIYVDFVKREAYWQTNYDWGSESLPAVAQ